MPSIRAKLTLAFAGAMLGTALAFALALALGSRAMARADVSRQAAANARQAATNADLALHLLQQAKRAGDTLRVVYAEGVGRVLTGRLRTLLEVVPGYIVIRDDSLKTLFRSPPLVALPINASQVMIDAASELTSPDTALQIQIPVTDQGARIDVLIVKRSSTVEAGTRYDVVSAVPADVVPAEPTNFGWLFVLTIVIIAVSAGVTYVIAGNAFRPLDVIMNEVEAITDGRSLHKRVAIDEEVGSELSKLVPPLNAMIGRLETSFGGLRRFTADASHELKTPLTVMRADVERAMHAPSGSVEQLIALEEALQETTRMADLVDSLLTLARADEGRFDLHREPLDLLALARDVFETAMILGEEQGLDVSMPIAEPARVMGDQTRLRHLFLNLITNAIKYSSRSGKVELMLVRGTETVSFSVRDTGIGIAAADLPFVFERFWRADRARSRASDRGGFGLGLAISQYIAQAHGGTLTVHSRLTRGSTFTVTLPQVHEEERAATAPAVESDAQPASSAPAAS